MVSNLVVRNKRTGYVTFVAKARVDGESRTVEYICGLGNMTQGEFKHFQKWAHGIKDQRMRRERVLACPLVATETTRVERKVAGVKQRKTTVKRAAKKVVKKPKRWFPLPRRPITHTEMMMKRAKQEKKEKLMREEKDRLKTEGLLGRKIEDQKLVKTVHKRPIKGLFEREREREAGKIRRERKEGFMFE